MTTIQKQDWHHSGSACCTPIGTCCLSWWCPCIVYGRTHHRVKNNGDMNGYSACNLACAGFCGLACLGISFVMPMLSRGDMRAKYHLKGNGCTDCLCACCCTPCDVTQQDKESAFREEQNRPLLNQPGKEGAMQYAAQPQNPAFHH
ncbi:PLAC8 family-domain-containing protein [Paraphoma chrysanthemicola]|uniref:PLAC8 family-domain-containing protein n=1 Tax=Paraphoma chrysanthemicola TaxID=798071 RepID=A0A8K0RFM4_9PLEO|nr:PLAC8 family-domain-containing protein [Paraphoma chrysanthemicola]